MAKNIKRRKPKYKLGQIVYCRPSANNDGMSVYRCKVVVVNHIGKEPYYDLMGTNSSKSFTLYIKYEHEISKRPERLVREAEAAMEKFYGPILKSYEERKQELKNLKIVLWKSIYRK